MPGSLVHSLAEDEQGFIWIGSGVGIMRWDGYEFHLYHPDSQRPDAPPNSIVQTMLVDSRGTLWLGTTSMGLARYHRETDGFSTVGAKDARLANATVRALVEDRERRLWVGTPSGLYRMSIEGGAIERMHGPSENGALPDQRVTGLSVGADGALWIGLANGLVRRNADGTLEPVALPVDDARGISVEVVHAASDGAVWVGTRRHGAFRVDPQTRQAHYVKGTASDGPTNGNVVAIVEARPGVIWLGTLGSGVLEFTLEGGNWRHLSHQPAIAASLADNGVRALLRSRTGLVWVGTNNGADRTDPVPSPFLTIFSSMPEAGGLGDRNVRSVLALSDGALLLGLGSNGLDYLAPHAGRVRGLRPSAVSGIPREPVLALAQVNQHQVYFGTSQGLYRLDLRSGRARQVSLPGAEQGLPVNALLVDQGHLWIGSVNGGVWKLDQYGELPRIPAFAAQMLDRRVTAFFRDADDTLYVGTRRGLFAIVEADGSVRWDLQGGMRIDGHVVSGHVTTVARDGKGRLWVGTIGSGILVKVQAPGAPPRWQQLHDRQGQPHSNITGLLDDGNGRTWVASDTGLALVRQDDLSVRRLLRPDGVAITSYWVRAASSLGNGELALGGAGGVTIVRPDLFREWEFAPALGVTRVRIGDKPAPGHIGAAGLTVGPEAGGFAVEFAALDLSAPEFNRYAYRLAGYQREWVEVDAGRRFAAYTNLAPGAYTLWVRGTNRAGRWSEHQLAIPVRILPAWYQTWWWYGAVIASALLGLGIAWRTRTALLRKRQGELERDVAERTAALVETNLELQQSTETMRVLGEVGRQITASLDVSVLFAALHRHTASLLNAQHFAVYRNAGEHVELLPAFRADHPEAVEPLDLARLEPDRALVRAARNGSASWQVESVADAKALCLYAVAPLIVDEQVFGVITMAALLNHGAEARAQQIFGSLCAYGAIALANVSAMEALRAAQAQLVQQEKMAALGGMVAGVAHEVNTPLGVTVSAISGLELVQRRLSESALGGSLTRSRLREISEDGEAYLKMAMAGAQRAAELIASFKNVLVGRENETVVTVDLCPLLRDLAIVWEREFANRGHRLQLDLPRTLEATVIPDALVEVLARALANCLDHAFGLGESGIVRLVASRLNGKACVSVEDNGQGMAPEVVARVCDPFFTTKSGAGGHIGLGMHVAHNHASVRLKGTLTIVSRIEEGTRVVLVW
jgi:ligand-binding sensor domain-containing protein/C4-dicarboxylate-specific signal transduction histidine kinase